MYNVAYHAIVLRKGSLYLYGNKINDPDIYSIETIYTRNVYHTNGFYGLQYYIIQQYRLYIQI